MLLYELSKFYAINGFFKTINSRLVTKKCVVEKKDCFICAICVFFVTLQEIRFCIMRRYLFVLSACVCASVFAVGQQLQMYSDYIAVFAPTAVAQMEEHGIPASITLAQGLLESGAGRSDLTQRSNNHFGIKCTSDWTGKTTAHDDDKLKECFRVYDDPSESYRDHSLFLKRNRYSSLFELDKTDYRGWAHGLKRCGYATDPNYPTKLIKLIEDYNLSKYDKMSLKDVEEPSEELKSRYVNSMKKKTSSSLPSTTTSKTAQKDGSQLITTKKSSSETGMPELPQKQTMGSISERKIRSTNGCKYIIARGDDTYAVISAEYNIAENRLRDFNEAGRKSEPKRGERVYLQHKKNHGSQSTHVVKAGETMRKIAQEEGIKLSKLYSYNSVAEGDQPEAGQVLRLKR